MRKKLIISKLIVLFLVLMALPANGAGEINLTLLGSHRTGIFDGGAAKDLAYDPVSRRLFVVNASDATLDILDISNPANPALETAIDITGYGASANSVAVRDDIVAVAVENEDAQEPGQVVFLNTEGDFLKAVTVGALPHMLTFTPDGQTLLVANEGEPNDDYTIDPEGSISIIDLADGVEQATVATAGFRAFNRAADELAAAGVRIFGPEASLAQDLEPEYITVSSDGATAWVTLQENNALAKIDIDEARVVDIIPLGLKDHSPTLQSYTFRHLPQLGVMETGQRILLGGFSGLHFDGIDPANGKLQFLTHPDRGPTGSDGAGERLFPLPDFQAEIVRFELDPASGQMEIVERIQLTQSGRPISGLPNLEGTPELAYADEIPLDLDRNRLARDPFGADFEGIVLAPDNSYWLVDEYRPAIYHFDTAGRLIDRFVPEGSNAGEEETGEEEIPAVYAQRRIDRGFEAAAYDNGKLYAFMQSPLDNPDSEDDAEAKASVNTRILEFDTTRGTTTGEYLYILQGNESDGIGDALALGSGQFLVIERDSAKGPKAGRKIFRISLEGATNLNALDEDIVGPGGSLEGMAAAALARAEIEPVKKVLFADLTALGYLAGDAPEGLAVVDENTLAILNDDAYQLAGSFDLSTGLLDIKPEPVQPVLGLLTLRNPIDASDEDGLINLTSWPLFGMYQPDAIAAFEANGQTYLITANEGDRRDYAGFSEAVRVADVRLDADAFPNAAALQRDSALGRLMVSGSLGDVDGDGAYEQLYPFGARSFSIRDADGALIYDSGGQLERLVAEINPDYFNTANNENRLDEQSADKGPEPEALAVGAIDGRTYAFIGLAQVSGIMIFDISEPASPQFVDYINNRNFSEDPEDGSAGDLGPEGLIFIAAAESPTRQPLLVVANEVSGSTSIYEIRGEEPAPVLTVAPPATTVVETVSAEEEDEGSGSADTPEASAQEVGEGVLVKNFASDELSITIGTQSFIIPDNTEQRLMISPGDYTFVATVPRGAVSGELSLQSEQMISLSIFWNERNILDSYQE